MSPVGPDPRRTLSGDKLVGYTLFAATGLFLGLLLHRGEVVLLVAPFVIALVVGLAGARRPALEVTAELSEDQALEGDQPAVRFTVLAERAAGRVELVARTPPGLLRAGEAPTTSVVVAQPGVHRAELHLTASRWGTFEIGPIAWRASDPARLLRFEGLGDVLLPIRVYPRPETLRRLVEPDRTTPFPGAHTSRRAGDGIELAELRPFVAGDRFRDVNARASARRGALFVTRRHPEQHANVVVLVDTTSADALEASVRCAVALVTAYAGKQDRVGVVAFGSMVRWVEPGLGDRHLYRVLQALLASEAPFTYVWRDLEIVPPKMLPPNALVWLVSPLDDDRPAGIAYLLRRRGFDVSVVEVRLEHLFPPGATKAGELAYRLWRLRRAARRGALRESGSAVVEWSEGRPMAELVEEARAFRARRRPGAR